MSVVITVGDTEAHTVYQQAREKRTDTVGDIPDDGSTYESLRYTIYIECEL